MQASKLQFACANPEKSEKTRSKMQQIQDEQDALLDFEWRNAHPVPHSIMVATHHAIYYDNCMPHTLYFDQNLLYITHLIMVP